MRNQPGASGLERTFVTACSDGMSNQFLLNNPLYIYMKHNNVYLLLKQKDKTILKIRMSLHVGEWPVRRLEI